jgi:ferric-dicitrate binding protein FerR (iron transport regulator)
MDEEQKYITLAKVLSGEASDAEQAELDAWLASDPGARAEWDEAVRLWQGADDVLATAPRFSAEAAWEKVSVQTLRPATAPVEIPLQATGAKRIALPGWTRYAMTAAAVLLIGLFILRPFGGSGEMTTVVAQYDNTPVVLADGSKVSLRAGSRLKHPEKFDGDTRSVTLEGEGFFEVARDEQHPFIVDAGAADVTVLGTSFSVQTGKAQTVVTVATGKVKVADEGSASVTLTPGQRGTVGSGTAKKELVRGSNHLFWKTGVLEYNATPLTDVVAEMNRLLAPNTITLDASLSPAQRTQAVTTRFEKQSVEEMLSELCIVAGLRLQSTGKSAYLITRK